MKDSDYFDYNSLTLFDRVFLGSLLNEGLDLSYLNIRPIASLRHPILPNNELLINTLSRVIQERILIVISKQGNTYLAPPLNNNHVNVYSKKQRYHYPYLAQVVSSGLSLNCHPSEKREIIESLISHSPNSPFNEIEMAHLWKSLAAWECVEYLDHKIIELFDNSPLNKEWVFNTMFQHLAELSQSEIFKTIEVSVFHALSYSNQKGISRERGAENALTTYQIFAENAINKEGWYKRGFDERPRDAPISLMLQFYLRSYLERKDDGFNVIPIFDG